MQHALASFTPITVTRTLASGLKEAVLSKRNGVCVAVGRANNSVRSAVSSVRLSSRVTARAKLSGSGARFLRAKVTNGETGSRGRLFSAARIPVWCGASNENGRKRGQTNMHRDRDAREGLCLRPNPGAVACHLWRRHRIGETCFVRTFRPVACLARGLRVPAFRCPGLSLPPPSPFVRPHCCDVIVRTSHRETGFFPTSGKRSPKLLQHHSISCRQAGEGESCTASSLLTTASCALHTRLA